MPTTNKIKCPDCGAEMNHHAAKIDYSHDDAAIVDPTFGGVLNEVHTCPECSKTELRPVAF
jgi:hypothetical protein